MAGAHPLELIAHHPVREFRPVALATQMTQIQMPQISRHDLLGGFRGGVIGQMTVTAEDALLETPRTMQTILQHFHIVIRFEHEHIRVTHPIDHQPRYMAKIRQKSDVGSIRAQEEPDWILRVMRHGESFNQDIANLETGSRNEQPAIQFNFELFFDRFLRRAIAIDWQPQFFSEDPEALNMIAVLVGDEDARKIFRRTPDQCEALANLPRTEPGIHKNTGFGGFHIGAVAGGTAS
jgi:hypothetical protein